MTGVLIKGKSGPRDRHVLREGDVKRHRENSAIYRPSNAWGYQKLTGTGRALFRAPPEGAWRRAQQVY